MYIYMYVLYICMYIYMYVYMYVYIYVCIYVCIYICMYICMYIYMYVYMYIYIYVLVNIVFIKNYLILLICKKIRSIYFSSVISLIFTLLRKERRSNSKAFVERGYILLFNLFS